MVIETTQSPELTVSFFLINYTQEASIYTPPEVYVGGLFDLCAFHLKGEFLLLLEFAFSPSAQAIELDYGESREVIFQASCVAYSAMGVVTVLSGQPKEGFVIEARAVLKGFYEGRITDSSGSFRLRGLLPDTT